MLGYLTNSGALADTPFKRLLEMNKPAIDLYLNHNIDLSKEPLEISVCAQHNNGGLKGNIWWESDLKHLFPVGEANGSHGVYRPGGSALNSGQVGSYRAALYISKHYAGNPPEREPFLESAMMQVQKKLDTVTGLLESGEEGSYTRFLKEIQHRMTTFGGIIRNGEEIRDAVSQAGKELDVLQKGFHAASVKDIAGWFRVKDLCLTHYLYLEAIRIYIGQGGRSRGSFLVTGPGYSPEKIPGEILNFNLCGYDRVVENNILEISYKDGSVHHKLEKVRPIPDQELWFEKVWKKNLEDNVTES